MANIVNPTRGARYVTVLNTAHFIQEAAVTAGIMCRFVIAQP
jgi:hypothetical protein